jgi:hypothetical protein
MKTIVWDLDDVLNSLLESWLALAWLPEHPECRLAYHQLRSNPPLRELQATREAYLSSLDRFRLSGPAQELRPHPLVMAWFEQQGSRFHHHVLTARPSRTIAPAAAWVFAHFGRWVRHFHFVPSPRPGDAFPAYDRTKAEVLGHIGPVDFFVDDSPENVRQAAAQGIRAFLFPQPWNQSVHSIESILADLAEDVQPSLASAL